MSSTLFVKFLGVGLILPAGYSAYSSGVFGGEFADAADLTDGLTSLAYIHVTDDFDTPAPVKKAPKVKAPLVLEKLFGESELPKELVEEYKVADGVADSDGTLETAIKDNTPLAKLRESRYKSYAGYVLSFLKGKAKDSEQTVAEKYNLNIDDLTDDSILSKLGITFQAAA